MTVTSARHLCPPHSPTAGGCGAPSNAGDCGHIGGARSRVKWATMKTIHLVVAVLLLAGVCASQQGPRSGFNADGHTLLTYCSAIEKSPSDPKYNYYNSSMCLGYVDASLDASFISAVQTHFCFPADLSRGQIYRAVLRYLRDHPEQLGQNGVVLVHKAMDHAFPC
jgi:Ssp1 endopeptidase immunity protein Rap1a